MAARDDEERVLRRRLRGAMGRDAAEDALIGMAYHGLAVADAAELTALRAVAEAADVLATTAQLAARHMPAGTIADLINDIAKVRAALDRAREGGGG